MGWKCMYRKEDGIYGMHIAHAREGGEKSITLYRRSWYIFDLLMKF